MDKNAALRFLRAHQPMPPEKELTEELARHYDSAREYFQDNPDPACIPLLLNSFGDGDGFGVYPLVEDVLVAFTPDQVVPALARALASPVPSVRYWCAQVAQRFSDPRLTDPLADLLSDASSDTRFQAVGALDGIPGKKVEEILASASRREKDREVKELMTEVLMKRRRRKK